MSDTSKNPETLRILTAIKQCEMLHQTLYSLTNNTERELFTETTRNLLLCFNYSLIQSQGKNSNPPTTTNE